MVFLEECLSEFLSALRFSSLTRCGLLTSCSAREVGVVNIVGCVSERSDSAGDGGLSLSASWVASELW